MKHSNCPPNSPTRTWLSLDAKSLSAHPWVRLAPCSLFFVPLTILEGISSGRGQADATSDLGDGSSTQVPLDEIWQGILQHGMRDPLIISIGLVPGAATIRLESGNHRIYPARQDGLTHLPVIGLASSQPVLNPDNGDHTFDLDRSGLDEWLLDGGRSPEFFDPYPHPIDLRAALRPMIDEEPVLCTREVHMHPSDEVGIVSIRAR